MRSKNGKLPASRVDSGQDVIVGVNKFKLSDEEPIDILDIDNDAVRARQTERLNEIRKRRMKMLSRCAWQA